MNSFQKIIYTAMFLIYLFIYILISMRIGVFVLELNNILIETEIVGPLELEDEESNITNTILVKQHESSI